MLYTWTSSGALSVLARCQSLLVTDGSPNWIDPAMCEPPPNSQSCSLFLSTPGTSMRDNIFLDTYTHRLLLGEDGICSLSWKSYCISENSDEAEEYCQLGEDEEGIKIIPSEDRPESHSHM